jgi:hypothetical protein
MSRPASEHPGLESQVDLEQMVLVRRCCAVAGGGNGRGSRGVSWTRSEPCGGERFREIGRTVCCSCWTAWRISTASSLPRRMAAGGRPLGTRRVGCLGARANRFTAPELPGGECPDLDSGVRHPIPSDV